ncbi:hypothetical protein LIER_31008 [Lithospermum erythrorhizon]|uniref:Uncharacterized protein n=1 Tax=Lithospermum erythrorhizon TaxID=34254 RepID=A0AAV3RSU4_LITER
MPLSPDLSHGTATWDVTKGSSRAAEGLASWASRETVLKIITPSSLTYPTPFPRCYKLLKIRVQTDYLHRRRDDEELHVAAVCFGGPWNVTFKPLQPFCLPLVQAKVVYALSLRLRDSSHRGDEVTRLKIALASPKKERDKALSKRDELADLCQKQHSEREGLLASAREASDIYKSKVKRLKKTTRELQAIEELHRSLDTSVEKFKRSEEYRSLLKGDTATLFRNICQKVAADFPGISSHFTNCVKSLGEDCVVSLFDKLPEEEPPHDDSGSDDSEDETGDES